MKVLELFAGSKSIGTAAKELGHEVFSSDYDPGFNTDYTVDILKFDTSVLPWKPDVIWASPPCESFSVASIGHHWNLDGTPKTPEALHGMAMVEKTLEIIRKLEPTYWFIENPRGKLRKMPFMQGHPYHHTVTYCQYGDDRMKPTDIWTNNPNWHPRSMCKNGMPCHVAAPRGSRTGTQGRTSYYDRSRIPHELCLEVMASLR